MQCFLPLSHAVRLAICMLCVLLYVSDFPVHDTLNGKYKTHSKTKDTQHGVRHTAYENSKTRCMV